MTSQDCLPAAVDVPDALRIPLDYAALNRRMDAYLVRRASGQPGRSTGQTSTVIARPFTAEERAEWDARLKARRNPSQKREPVFTFRRSAAEAYRIPTIFPKPEGGPSNAVTVRPSEPVPVKGEVETVGSTPTGPVDNGPQAPDSNRSGAAPSGTPAIISPAVEAPRNAVRSRRRTKSPRATPPPAPP